RDVIVSNMIDFFQDFQSRYGSSLPSVSVSYGDERELSRAQFSEWTARMKRAVEKLRSAEALATLVSLKNPCFLPGRAAERDQAWMNIGLFWEHNWRGGSTVPITDWRTWIKGVVVQVENYVNTLYTDSVNALAGMIPRGANPRFLAFNPLSWTRSDITDI